MCIVYGFARSPQFSIAGENRQILQWLMNLNNHPRVRHGIESTEQSLPPEWILFTERQQPSVRFFGEITQRSQR
jgi:hypothetical protein